MSRAGLMLKQFASRFLNEPIDGTAPRSHCLRESDIFLASYPRSGNTWVRVILANLLLGPGALTGLKDVDSAVPDIHRGIPRGAPRALPRIIKTHQPFAFRHESHRSELYRRLIYVVRNPVDSIRSYHDFLSRSDPGFSFNLNDFAHAVVNGSVYPGSWNEHVLSWTKLEGRDLLLVRYEELSRSPIEWIGKMAAFIGCATKPETLEAVLKASDLKSMRALDETAPLVPTNKDFIRQEETARAYREELTPQSLALIHSRSAEAMREAGYISP